MAEDRLEAIRALDDAAERAGVNISKGIQRDRHPEPERRIVEELEAAGWRLVKAAALAAVTEERDAARADAERLARYAQHTRGCLNWTWPESCDCGFDTQVVPIVRGLAAHRSLR